MCVYIYIYTHTRMYACIRNNKTNNKGLLPRPAQHRRAHRGRKRQAVQEEVEGPHRGESLSLSLCLHICICICMYACVCVYIYIYIHHVILYECYVLLLLLLLLHYYIIVGLLQLWSPEEKGLVVTAEADPNSKEPRA